MKKMIGFLSVIITIAMTVYSLTNAGSLAGNITEKSASETTEQSFSSTSSDRSTSTKTEKNAQGTLAKKSPIDWRKPSENTDYPDLTIDDQLLVDTKKNRVYVQRNDEAIYTMYCSAGSADTPTPKGDFVIEPERGEHFVNNATGEGTNYYVSFKDHGIYLFHTVPVDESGAYIVSEAEKLGKQASSHGCVRLSVADAKWLYENVVVGMKVKVE